MSEIVSLPCSHSLWRQRVWTLGLDQTCWNFAHLALMEARYALLIPSAPKVTQTVARFDITCCKNPTGSFRYSSWNKVGFWVVQLGFLSLEGGKSAIFLCAPCWKICCNKNLGFKSPGVRFDLGCPFYCSSFPVFDVWVPHICGDFHRHVLCSGRRGGASGLETPALRLGFD